MQGMLTLQELETQTTAICADFNATLNVRGMDGNDVVARACVAMLELQKLQLRLIVEAAGGEPPQDNYAEPV